MSELEDTVKNLEICRLCLNLTVVKINIFTEDFAKMIEILTSLKVKPDDSLPKVSCLKCARDVKSAFLVRRRIIQSYRAFNHKINRLGVSSYDQPSTPSGSSVNDNVRPSTSTDTTPLSGNSERPTEILRSILDKGNSSNKAESYVQDSYNESENAHTSDDEFSDIVNNGKAESDEQSSMPSDIKLTNKSQASIVEEPDESHFLQSLEPQVVVQTKSPLSAKQSKKIQNLKLDINMKYIEKLRTMETTQKVNAWKLMNKKDQVNILKWMERKKDNKKNITRRLASMTQPKKKEPMRMFCNHCQVKFTNKITYKNHMTRHKHKTCPVCDKQIRSAYLKKHMTLHEDAPVICEICGQTCKNPCSLRMHFFYYHKNPNFCVCEDCGRSFRTKTKLLYHQRKDHTKERNFKCETCGKSFFLKMYLTKHINMKHMKLRPHICEYCGKGFSGKHALRTHVRQHTNEAPYQCNFCGERFRQRVSLRGHLKSRHKIEEENKVFCDTCGKGFASVVALDVHSRLHKEIKCPWCSDTFAEKEYLEQHITTTHPNANDENVVDDEGFKWMNL